MADLPFHAITSFGQPAFTYILKLDINNVKEKEKHLQHMLNLNYRLDNLEPDTSYQLAYAENASADDYNREYPADRFYTGVICAAAQYAVTTTMVIKQGTTNPRFSSFIQVEIGARDVHTHIILAGDGINKHNAKHVCRDLSINFYEFLTRRIHYHLSTERWADEEKQVADELLRCLEKARNSHEQLCKVLQYKSHRGQTHATHVDPLSFITYYLLPKNHQPHSKADPTLHTPGVDWFALADKTYAVTLINGQLLSPGIRRALQNKCSIHLEEQRATPLKQFELFESLPEVSAPGWDQPSTSQQNRRMNKKEEAIVSLMQTCAREHLLTYEAVVDNHPEQVIILEAMPGGGRLVQQMLQMLHIKLAKKHTALSYIQEKYKDHFLSKENKVIRLLNIQGYNYWQVGHWLCCVLSKQAGKQNTVMCYGPASTGKTNFIKAIVNCVGLYGNVNHLNRSFVFNDCANKLVLWWEECLMCQDWVEPAKMVLGGTEVRIDKKHSESMLLPQTPVLISTNNNVYESTGGNMISHVHAAPLRERIVQLNFMKCLAQTFGEISTQEIASWLLTCANKFDCTLQGFREQWGLDKVPNCFPMSKLCDSHTQDLTYEEWGTCTTCGGYLPLSQDARAAEPADPINPSGPHTPPRSGKILLEHNYCMTPSKLDFLCDFDICLLDTPKKKTSKRPLDTSDREDQEKIGEVPPAPKKQKPKVSVQVTLDDCWCTPPETDLECALHNAQQVLLRWQQDRAAGVAVETRPARDDLTCRERLNFDELSEPGTSTDETLLCERSLEEFMSSSDTETETN